MTIPTIAIVGFSDSGKTRVAAALVQLLTRRGYRVAAFKHAPHGHEPSPPGKDSDQLRRAGARDVTVSSPGMVTRTALHPGELGLEELIAGLSFTPDIVIAEGFKASSVPKVLIEGAEAVVPYPANVVAVIGKKSGAPGVVPRFAMERLEELADFLQETAMAKQDGPETEAAPTVELAVDGIPVPLKQYPASALDETIRGFLRSLNGVPSDARTIEIRLHRE